MESSWWDVALCLVLVLVAIRKLGVRSPMFLVMLGGALGTYARYVLGRWISNQPWAEGFHYGTFFINVTGSFILGFVAVFIMERLSPEYQPWFLLMGTGFCGGYTTFSTFELET